jgi:uncharacterized integral membrane protein
MPAQTSPPPGAARPLPSPSANGSVPSPPGAARPPHPILRTRISGIRTALIAGVLALIVLVIFIVQNAQAVKLSFLGRPGAAAGRGRPAAGRHRRVLLMAAGTARITQLRRAIGRTRRGQPPAPATPGR